MNPFSSSLSVFQLRHFVFIGLTFLWLLATTVMAQPVQYRFQHFTSENGLPQNTVYDVCQDKYGFMWFSTRNGVCRYDGYSVKIYKPTDHYSDDVVDMSQCVETDDEGNIVFGTGFGIYVVDVERDSLVRRIIYGNADSADANTNNIYSLCAEGPVIWAGTGNGLLRYDRTTNTVEFIEGRKIYPAFKSSRLWVKNIIYDGKGSLWLATPDGLIRMNTRTYKTEVYNATATDFHHVSNTYFSSIDIDKSGRIWAGSLRQGAFCIDLRKRTIENINYTGLTDSSESFNETKRLICDSHGTIWAATQYTGLVRINPETKALQRIRYNPFSQYALSSDLASALYENKSGILWVGTYNSGVDRTNVTGSRFINIPYASSDSSCFSIKAVECFAEQGKSKLWVGTMNGLFLFDKTTHICNSIEELSGGKIKLPHQSVSGLEVDKDGMLWVGTRSQILLKINVTDFSYKSYEADTTEPLTRTAAMLNTFIQSPGQKLFFSFNNRVGYYNDSLDRINILVDRDSLLLKVTRVNRLSADERYLFVSGDLLGLVRYDLKTSEAIQMHTPDPEKDRLSQNVLVRKFRNGNYLISDFKGFYLTDADMQFKSFYNDKNGLSDNKISNSNIDLSGNVWLATFNGLTLFDPVNKKFQQFYIQDGLMENEFREAKSLLGSDGLLYLPTNKGFTYFDPAVATPSGKKADVFFTGFSIYNRNKTFGKNLNNINVADIPAGSSFFTIAFASTGYNTLQPSAFVYMLEGVDRDWVTTNGNLANYTNIEGGNYIFRVKALSEGSSERTLNIHVGTLFYKTWWFRSLLVLLLVTVIFSFVRFRENLVMKRESAKIIEYFANSHYGSNSVEEILWDVCRNCISRLGFEDAVVYMLEPSRKVLIQKAAYGPKNPKDDLIVDPLEIPVGYGIVGAVARSGKPELITDTTRDQRYIADDRRRMSELAVPIIYDDKVIGVIDSEHSQKGFFNSEHLRLIATIASICSTKIAKAQSDQEADERERKLLEIGKKVAETRLMALRAQMNPHFIFNSLNSIQECIVNEKIEEAHIYLSQFSKLLRLVIDYSEKSLITLDQEIVFLKLYLGLESLRFGQRFRYEIVVGNGLDEEEVRVPSLLIQPFAENAIWHGLLHKEGERKLLISFNAETDDTLKCIIEDNGIGRERAAEIKSRNLDGVNHESKGMRISQERLDLIRLQTDLDSGIKVEDLKDVAGVDTGTRVTLTLPMDLSSGSRI